MVPIGTISKRQSARRTVFFPTPNWSAISSAVVTEWTQCPLCTGVNRFAPVPPCSCFVSPTPNWSAIPSAVFAKFPLWELATVY